MTDNRERLRRVLLGRLESLERAGVQQLPKAAIASCGRRDQPSRRRHAPVAAIAAEPTHVGSTSTRITEVNTMAQIVGLAAAVEERCSRRPTNRCRALPTRRRWPSCSKKSPPAPVAANWPRHERKPCSASAIRRPGSASWAKRRGPTKTGSASRSSAAAGNCLNKIIEACRLKREDVYILNMLKCRPPGNRNPLPDELTNCRRFLERQLELIQPEFICCLGAVASQNLLGTTTPIGKLRGKLHAYRGAKVVCTYHPAYLLRNPAAKKDSWDDMKFLMREMGVEL